MDYNIPTPSVEIYFYGVIAYTPGYGNSNNITTSFSILGKLNQTSSSKSFRKSGSGEICDYKSNGIGAVKKQKKRLHREKRKEAAFFVV